MPSSVLQNTPGRSYTVRPTASRERGLSGQSRTNIKTPASKQRTESSASRFNQFVLEGENDPRPSTMQNFLATPTINRVAQTERVPCERQGSGFIRPPSSISVQMIPNMTSAGQTQIHTTGLLSQSGRQQGLPRVPFKPQSVQGNSSSVSVIPNYGTRRKSGQTSFPSPRQTSTISSSNDHRLYNPPNHGNNIMPI